MLGIQKSILLFAQKAGLGLHSISGTYWLQRQKLICYNIAAVLSIVSCRLFWQNHPYQYYSCLIKQLEQFDSIR